MRPEAPSACTSVMPSVLVFAKMALPAASSVTYAKFAPEMKFTVALLGRRSYVSTREAD